jgi:hypothetical protein
VGKPEGKRPLGRPRRRWVDDIKMDFRKIGWDCIVQIGSGAHSASYAMGTGGSFPGG